MKTIKLYAAAILYLLLMFTTSHAATITVDAPNGAISFSDGFCSLSEAILNANGDNGFQVDCTRGSGDDTIVLTNSVILDSIYTSNDPVYGATGTPTIISPMTIDGDGFTLQRDNNLSCVLDSNSQSGEFRLLHQLDENNLLTIKHINLSNGCADSDDIPNQTSRYGGALFGLFINIRDVNFINNKATLNGGAIFANNIQGLRNSTFLNNYSGFNGGAISLGGTSSTITNSTFSANTSNHFGGAIYLRSNATLNNSNNNTFHNNEAEKGGAIYSEGTVSNLTNNVFHFNTATSTGFAIDDCQKSGVSSGNLTGSNNISNHIDSDSGCPGLIQPRLQSSDIIGIANNGGKTLTHALAPDSTAINKAINGLFADQRGLFTATIRDLGAYEVQHQDFCVGAFANNGFNVNVATSSELNLAMKCSQYNGSNPDTINLTTDIIIDDLYELIVGLGGDNGTPIVTTPLLLDGQGFTLKRNNNLTCNLNGTQEVDEFRILHNQHSGSLALHNITIENGCADGINEKSLGGGLYNQGNLSVIDSLINLNQANDDGGGIYHEDGSISQINSSIFSNNSTKGSGGAIFTQDIISIIQDTAFSNNSATGSGGAIENHSQINFIKNGTFSGNNTDVSGGAIANFSGLGSLQNNTFSSNSAIDFGGALFNNDTISSIENNTFSSNTANTLNGGGGIYSPLGTDVNNLKNSLFHNNTNRDCFNINNSITGSNNISSHEALFSGCPGLVATRLTAVTVKQLADNGGPTMTHGLQPGSEALDAAVAGLNSDQRGLSANGVRDIGAFEAQPSELCSGALQANGFTTDVTNVDELYYAMSCSKLNGNNPDTINLTANIILLSEYENDPSTGLTGTPGITTPLILDGNEFTLERDSNLTCNLDENIDPGEFRLLHNHIGNTLFLKNIALVNGCADADFNDDGARFGGALYNEGNLVIYNASFSQNKAIFGGALFHDNGIISEISNSTFAGNTAETFGGAIINSSDIIKIENTTFSGNSALTNAGGAIFNQDTISNIYNSTFSGNSAAPFAVGGAISNSNNLLFIRNTIFHNNGNDECHNNNNSFAGNNNISDNASGGCPALIPSTLTSNTIALLADNGGFTQTHALLPGSEAFNNANNGLSTDQRGFQVTDGSRDIGAFEDQVPVVTAPDDIEIEATGNFTPVNEGMLGSVLVNDPEQPSLTATSNLPNFLPLGSHDVVWSATDYHGHNDTDIQVVTLVDTTPPTLTLNGNSTVLLNIGDNYNDAGASATDTVYGNRTGFIVINNPVNTSLVGNYTVTYDVQDGSGNSADQVTRLVKVQATIGGSVSGLINSNTVTISDTNQSLVLSNGSYTFSTSVDFGSDYSVSIALQPNGATPQTCIISNNSDTVSTSNITNVNVTCGPKKYFVSGMASGLEIANPVILELNGQLLQVDDNAAFVFLNPLEDGTEYTVSIDTLPTSPYQACDIVNPTGSIAGDDVIDVEVNCTTLDIMFKDGFED